MGKPLVNIALIVVAFAWLGIGAWMIQAVPLGPVGLAAVIVAFSAPAISSIAHRLRLLFTSHRAA